MPSHDAKVLAKGLSINVLGTLFKLARGVSYVVIVRLFGASVFGTYALCWAVVEMLSKCAIVGCDQANIRFVAQGQTGVLRYTLRMVLAASLLVVIGLYAAAPLIVPWFIADPQAVGAVRVLLLSIPCIAITSVTLGALKGRKLVQYEMLLRSLVEPIAFLGFVAVAYFVAPSLYGVIVAHLATWIVIAGLGLYFAHKHGLLAGEPLSSAATQQLRRFILPLPLYDLCYFLLGKKDLFLIGILLDPVAVGLFTVVNEIATSAHKIRQAFEPILAPMTAELHHHGDAARLQTHYKTAFRWGLLLYGVFVAGLWVLSTPILHVFGAQFVPTQTTLMTLVIAYSIQGIFLPAETSLVMSGRSLLNLFNMIGLLILNILLNLLLIPAYGMWGAALGTLCAIAVVSAVRVAQVYALFGKHPFARTMCWPTREDRLLVSEVWRKFRRA